VAVAECGAVLLPLVGDWFWSALSQSDEGAPAGGMRRGGLRGGAPAVGDGLGVLMGSAFRG